MRMRIRLVLILLAILLHTTATPSAQAATSLGKPMFFPETGHTLAYNFRIFFDRWGGVPVFGLPLTEVFMEEGRPVQYFERARMEWHADTDMVELGHLGRWLAREKTENQAFEILRSRDVPVGSRFFPETSHSTQGIFLDYWQRNGDLAIFGFPISEPLMERLSDGERYVVQYFERARFEYHPELAHGKQVLLGHLGRAYLAENPAPANASAPVSSVDAAWSLVRPTRVQIQRIGLDTEIVEGGYSAGEWEVPRYTATHYWPIAGFPGGSGNVILAGHVGYRGIIFNQLPKVKEGDSIILTVGGSDRTYVVQSTQELLPSETWALDPTAEETLTMITCVPIGVYTHRLIVRAIPESIVAGRKAGAGG